MNTLSVGKTLLQCTLTALFTGLLASCGGDSSNSATGASSDAVTTKKRDLISYMYEDETSQPLKGNGIWNYSVATDYYYGTMKPPQSPSLAVDLPANPDANIEYVFATFISLAKGSVPNPAPPGIPTPPLLRDQCISDGVVPVIAYYALPIVNPDIYPTPPSPLGGCVAGKSTTAYYAGIFPNAPLKVVPVAEYADDTFPAFMSTAADDQIITIATALAQAIVNDTNTYGLAIDNEKSINGSNPNAAVGQQKEGLFFSTLATQLGAGGKFLFLFDAATSAKTLYSNNKNIVFMQPLYDLDNSDPNDHTTTPYNPDPLSSPYAGSVKSVAAGTLTNNAAPGQSVMFVVPASATSTIWDYEMAYNITQSTYVNPIINRPEITANSQGICSGIPRDDITNTVLTAMIGATNIAQFLGSGNCSLFTNTTKLNDYFLTSLNAITSARAQNNQQVNYLGAALYAWRISGMNDINAAKYYPSIYTANGGSQKSVNLQGPPDIQSTTWGIFNNWVNPKK
jgi:hypothetical protein